jgi:hypothetical protein
MITKNKISLFIIFLIGIIGITYTYSVECGDVNGDESISIVDALLIARYYVDLETSMDYPDQADVNNDGTIDIRDALMVAQFYVGIIEELECAGEPTPAPTNIPGTIWVSRPSGIQCEVTYYNNAIEALNHLQNAGITVLEMKVLEYMVVAVCGTPTGTIYQALIYQEDLEKAIDLGWG